MKSGASQAWCVMAGLYRGPCVEPLLSLPCSILGMHLFGCKFASERDGDTLPDRKNFDSLLWAIVTVFQVQNGKHHNSCVFRGCEGRGCFPKRLTDLSEAPCRGRERTQNHKCRSTGVVRPFSRINEKAHEEGLPRLEVLAFAGCGLGG